MRHDERPVPDIWDDADWSWMALADDFESGRYDDDLGETLDVGEGVVRRQVLVSGT